MKHFIALEAGGTRTRGALFSESGELIAEREGPGANPVAYGIEQSVQALRQVAESLAGSAEGRADILVGLAGAACPEDRKAIGAALCAAVPCGRAVVSTDLYPLLSANAGSGAGALAISGTGSSVLAQNAQGDLLRVGARGAVFGDDGSAYQIAVAALRVAALALDGIGTETALVETLPSAAGVTTFEQLPAWSSSAGKNDVAALAATVSETAEQGDHLARSVIEDQARRLALQVQAAEKRLKLPPGSPLFVSGGVFEQSRLFREAFEEAIEYYSHLAVVELKVRGPEAVLSLRRCFIDSEFVTVVRPHGAPAQKVKLAPAETLPSPEQTPLDALKPLELTQKLLDAEQRTFPAVRQQTERIAQVVARAAQALEEGGRIFYIGAGTSGRLGVLDASECPPTFGVAPDRVIGIIAGGEAAMTRSVEGAEDDTDAGAAVVEEYCISSRDLVVGIAASGTTPYTLAALHAARARDAATTLLCCNPTATAEVDFLIALDTGTEVLTGSTRLKAGTATKLVLNAISTGAFTLAGHVYRGYMVGVQPTNVKLRNRAGRILCALTNLNGEQAIAMLEASGWNLRAAILMHRAKLTREEAEAALQRAQGNLRRALLE